MGEAVLVLDIFLDGFEEVKGKTGEACMIFFHGTVSGPWFTGKILPGGVDTQKQKAGEKRFLSARYILEGKDRAGNACRIFIENNGTQGEDGVIRTRPLVYTDSEELSWMERAVLAGEIEDTGERGHIVIRIGREN